MGSQHLGDIGEINNEFMSYKRIGNKVYKKVGGKWVVKGKSKTATKAKRYLAKLNMVGKK